MRRFNPRVLLLLTILLTYSVNFVRAQPLNCTPNGTVVDISWFQLQSIGEGSFLTAFLTSHIKSPSVPPACIVSNLSGQQIQFYINGSRFGSSVYTNLTGIATLDFNTSVLGFGSHSVYAVWNGSGGAYSMSPVENITIVKRIARLAYTTPNSSNGAFELNAQLVGCSEFINNVTGECAPLSGQMIDFYFGNSFIGRQTTNSSGIAKQPYNTSGLPPGNYSVFLVYNGDMNDTAASAAGSLAVSPHPVSPIVVIRGNAGAATKSSSVPNGFGYTLVLVFVTVVVAIFVYHSLHARYHERKMAEKEREEARARHRRTAQRRRPRRRVR